MNVSTRVSTRIAMAALLASCGSFPQPARNTDAEIGDGAGPEDAGPDAPLPDPITVHNQSVGSFAVDGSYVYWASANQIWRLAKVGSAAAAPIVTMMTTPQSLAVDASSIYWPEYSQQRVMKAPLGGGAPVLLAGSLGTSPQFVHLDATSAYWPTDGGTSSIQTVAKAGGTATNMITTGQPDDIEVDASYIYWLSGSSGTTGTINRLNKATLGNQVIGTVGGALRAIAVDDTHVYAASATTVVRVPKTGGTVETIATDQANIGDLAVGITSVFWTNSVANGTVMRARTSGGGVGPVALGQSMASWILVDGNTVYWSVSGKLVKVDVASP
jgi:hypothetical protein